MKDAACQHEKMEDAMHPFPFAAKAVQDRADGVGDAAEQKKQKTGQGDDPQKQARRKHDAPAGAQVANQSTVMGV